MFLKISQNSQKNTCTGISFLSATTNFINEETPAQCFPKPLTIFAKSSIADVRLAYKYASVLPPDLKPICKDFLLRKSVIKIATVLYYHYRFVIRREQQSNIALAIYLLNGIRFSHQQSVSFLLSFAYRSICWQTFFKIGALKNFTNFTGKHLCWSIILVKLQPGLLQLC